MTKQDVPADHDAAIRPEVRACGFAYRLFPTAGRPSVWGLLIPADIGRPCQLIPVTLSAASFSAAIGGGLLDEVPVECGAGQAHTVYQDAGRDACALAHNARAWAMAARLNWPHLSGRISLRGDVLVTGLDEQGQDTHVPPSVLGESSAPETGYGAV